MINTHTLLKSVLKVSRILIQTIILGVCLARGGLLAQTLPLPQNLINLNSAEGEKLLLES